MPLGGSIDQSSGRRRLHQMPCTPCSCNVADQLKGCSEGLPEEAELKVIADPLNAYDCRRWPDGKAAVES